MRSPHAQPELSADKPGEKIMGLLLRTGVILAALIVLAGAIVDSRQQTSRIDYHTFGGEPAELRSPGGIVHSALTLDGRGLIQFGLLLLIATPIARVIFSVVLFVYERDWTYVVVTLIVLAALSYSLLGRHG
jgi:uncharacterized membrane protein